MKRTTNNFQKATIRFTTVLASLILICFTISAQNFLKENSNKHIDDLILAYNISSTDSKIIPLNSKIGSNLLSDLVTESAEMGLVLEEWMINETYFTSTSIFMKESIENSLEIENWMTNDHYFYTSKNDTPDIFEHEEEQVLEVENWMFDSNTWNR